MRWAVLPFVLVACVEQPTAPTEPTGPTFREAAEITATGLCERWVRCGTETQLTVDECIVALVDDVCGALNQVEVNGVGLCEYPYTWKPMDEVVECARSYSALACYGDYVEPCSL